MQMGCWRLLVNRRSQVKSDRNPSHEERNIMEERKRKREREREKKSKIIHSKSITSREKEKERAN